VVHGFSTRLGGVSRPPWDSLDLGTSTGDDPGDVARNRERLLAALGLAGRPLATVRQVHGSRVVRVGAGGLPVAAAEVVEADALWTTEAGLAVAVRVADCVPVLLHAPEVGAVAAVHAGWRGTALSVVVETVHAWARELGADPARIRAGIGPAIGAARYEVGPEVVAALERSQPPEERGWRYADSPHGRARVDLGEANAALLRSLGVPGDSIGRVPACTFDEPALFYSHRRTGGVTGRQAAVIALAP